MHLREMKKTRKKMIGSNLILSLDPFELLDPVEILSKLPKNFYEQVSILYTKNGD